MSVDIYTKAKVDELLAAAGAGAGSGGLIEAMSGGDGLAAAVRLPTPSGWDVMLADTGGAKPVYVVYLAGNREVAVDLSRSPEETVLSIEWLDIRTGQTVTGGTARGGALRTFHSPLAGDGVLVLDVRSPGAAALVR